jgi:hypothetical protein
VTIKVEQIINGSITWKQNSAPWTESFPQIPYLVALYEREAEVIPSYNVAIANGLGIDPRVGAFPARIGEVLEIVFKIQDPQQVPLMSTHSTHMVHIFMISEVDREFTMSRRMNYLYEPGYLFAAIQRCCTVIPTSPLQDRMQDGGHGAFVSQILEYG